MHRPSQKPKLELFCVAVLFTVLGGPTTVLAAPAKSTAAVASEEGTETDDDENPDADQSGQAEDSSDLDVDVDAEADVDADSDGEESEREQALDEDSVDPAVGLSELELLELEALEQLERSDGLASNVRIRTLRRKRARLAKRAKIRSEVGQVGHSRVGVGFLGTGLASLRKGEDPGGVFGFGGLVDFSVVQGELELGLSTRALFEEEGVHVPIQLLLKKPWDVKRVRFFLGVGPAVVFGFHADEGELDGGDGRDEEAANVGAEPPSVHFGFASVAGLTWKFRPRIGLTVEMNYNIVIEGGAAHELGVSTGLVFAL